MADITVNSNELKIETYYVDGDTRNITLKNTDPTLTSAQIEDLQTWMQINQPIVGDKNGAAFGKINKATKIQKTQIALDIDN